VDNPFEISLPLTAENGQRDQKRFVQSHESRQVICSRHSMVGTASKIPSLFDAANSRITPKNGKEMRDFF
jgi:hypothetical protein